MFGKKAKELAQLLDKSNTENETLKKRITELEAEVDRLKEQENLVVRALTEANRTACRIEDEANEQRDKLIDEAEQHVKEANDKADGIIKKADEDAGNIRKGADAYMESLKKQADDYAETQKKEADSYSENIRTDANIYVERTIIASQLEVKKRKDVMAELNELLKKTTDYLTEQTETFKDMLKTVIEDNEEQTADLTREIEKCNCSCESCKDPCMEHAGKMPKKGEGEEGDEDEDEDETEEGGCEEAVTEEPEANEEAPAESDPSPAAADLLTVDAPDEEEKEFASEELPREYRTPAELMRTIYLIQKRDIPAKTEPADKAEDAAS